MQFKRNKCQFLPLLVRIKQSIMYVKTGEKMIWYHLWIENFWVFADYDKLSMCQHYYHTSENISIDMVIHYVYQRLMSR